MKLLSIFAGLVLTMGLFLGTEAFADCQGEVLQQYQLKSTHLKIHEYFGTFSADFIFPKLADYDCEVKRYETEEGEPEWKIVTWKLPGTVAVEVTYKDSSGRVTQTDKLQKISLSLVGDQKATYFMRGGKVQTFFGGIKFLLRSDEAPTYNLLRGARTDLAIGRLRIQTW